MVSPANRSLALLALVYLLLAWFVSALLTSAGLFAFVGASLALAVCLVASVRGRQRPLSLLFLITAMVAVTFGLGELGLRAAPQVLNGVLANHAYCGYDCQPGGIYQRDSHLGHTLKP